MLHKEHDENELALNFNYASDKVIKATDKGIKKIEKAYVRGMLKKALGISLIVLGAAALLTVAAVVLYGMWVAGPIALLAAVVAWPVWFAVALGVGSVGGGFTLYEKANRDFVSVVYDVADKLSQRFGRFMELLGFRNASSEHREEMKQINVEARKLTGILWDKGGDGLSEKRASAKVLLTDKVKKPFVSALKSIKADTSKLGMFGNSVDSTGVVANKEDQSLEPTYVRMGMGSESSKK